jgi:hypothetical protein
MNQHIGTSFDDFLAEEGILADVERVAWRRVMAFQIVGLMAERGDDGDGAADADESGGAGSAVGSGE